MSASHSDDDPQPTGRRRVRSASPTELRGFDLRANISHLLRRAHFRAEAIFEEQLREFDTTPRQKALLLASLQHPGSTINQLAEHIALDRTSTTEMLHRLVKRGLLSKARSPHDGRAFQIDITDAGVDLLLALLPGDREVERLIVAPLPEEYRPLFLKCLRLLNGIEP